MIQGIFGRVRTHGHFKRFSSLSCRNLDFSRSNLLRYSRITRSEYCIMTRAVRRLLLLRKYLGDSPDPRESAGLLERRPAPEVRSWVSRTEWYHSIRLVLQTIVLDEICPPFKNTHPGPTPQKTECEISNSFLRPPLSAISPT